MRARTRRPARARARPARRRRARHGKHRHRRVGRHRRRRRGRRARVNAASVCDAFFWDTMSTRGSRLEARNQREPVAQEARVKSWEKRCVCSRDGALVRARARARKRQKRDALCARTRDAENVGFLARIALERARGHAHARVTRMQSRFSSRRLTVTRASCATQRRFAGGWMAPRRIRQSFINGCR